VDAIPKPVAREWFSGPTLEVAERLLGMVLVHLTPAGRAAVRIVEVEAYRGPEDQGAHSFGGRLTPRTRVMFGEAGHAYVFQIYGMHFCFNVVTAGAGRPEAVLVRAGEPILGQDLMARRRRTVLDGTVRSRSRLTAGPARLTEALAIDRRHYGLPLWTPPLYIADGGLSNPPEIATGPRINIDYAGQWAERPWRFWIRGNPYVSRP
jgi:DNA-3-methyladenine glycosylase